MRSVIFFFFSSRRRHTRYWRDWSSDVCSSDLMFSGSGADHRLPLALFLLLIAAASPRFSSQRAARLVGFAAAVILLARMAVIETVWLRADDVYEAESACLDALPRDANLAVAFPPSGIHAGAIPELHVATLA